MFQKSISSELSHLESSVFFERPFQNEIEATDDAHNMINNNEEEGGDSTGVMATVA